MYKCVSSPQCLGPYLDFYYYFFLHDLSDMELWDQVETIDGPVIGT